MAMKCPYISYDVSTGERNKEFTVDVMYNKAIEWHESFSLQLGPQLPENAQFGPITTATITILDNEVSGSVVLPSPPIVVSLLHLDDADKGVKVNPSSGYPIVCLNPCESRHPNMCVHPQTIGLVWRKSSHRGCVASETDTYTSAPPQLNT